MHTKQGLAAVLSMSGIGIMMLSLESIAYVMLENAGGSRASARTLIQLQAVAALCVAAAMIRRFMMTFPSKLMPSVPIAVLSCLVAAACLLRAQGLAPKTRKALRQRVRARSVSTPIRDTPTSDSDD